MKKKKTFFIRIDLESQKGIKEGLPKILDVLKKNNVKGSFYLTMGGESNIFEILKNRGKLESSGERKIKIWRLRDKIRMTLFPIDFVSSNKKILRRILNEGHELGLHGWKHREWTRSLENLNLDKTLKKSVTKYFKIFGIKPISWSSPGFNVNENVLEILDKFGIKYISDFQDKEVKDYHEIKNIPLTILGKNRMPFIEFWIGEGLEDKEILKKFEEEILGKEIASFYIHGLFEGRFKIKVLDKMIKLLKEKGFENKRIIDY